MNIRKKLITYVISTLIVITYSCSEKFDVTQFEVSDGEGNIGGDTLFVQINPGWDGFNKPQDVMVGREPFIYVADTENDRVVLLNLDGQILSQRSIIKPVALAQDYRLNLIVCAQFDTSIGGVIQTFSAVYKLDLVSATHQLEIAPIKRLLPQLADFTQPQRVYTGTAAFFDNTYFVSRKGPNNTNLVDPDNSVLIFAQRRLNDGTTLDSLVGRVPLLDPTGSGIISANQISSITSFDIQSYDMILTLVGENSFRTQWLEFIVTPDFTGYQIALPPAANDLMLPGFFEQPEGSAVDPSGNIYVTDAAKDSVYKFNAFGDLLIGFGGTETEQFNTPSGVAFFDRILYVADTGNNRILRFILSTDIQ
jgi:DNA-binding beta-propeller fold protein YncE